MTETKLAPCAWCNRDVMDYMKSFNGKDICTDCEDDEHFCEAELPDGISIARGTAFASCYKCGYRCAYWECACDLVHDCEDEN